MPYLHCPSCGLASFSAARYSSRDECPRCGTDLATRPRRLLAPHPPELAKPVPHQPARERPKVA